MKVKLKRTVNYAMNGLSESHSCTSVKTRDLTAISDEPLNRGGTNQGLAPTELVMAALIGCTNVIAHKVAAQREIRIDLMEIDMELTLNQLGVNLVEEVYVPFEEIRMTVEVTSPASPDEINSLAEDVAKFCAVSKMLRQSGTSFIESWRVKRAGSENVSD